MVDLKSPDFSPLAPVPAGPAPRRQRVPKKIREAIDAIAWGRAKTKKSAAEKFGGISREYFSRSFKNPAVVQYAKEAAARAVAMGVPRAAAVLNELADSSSERVRLEAAKASLQAAQVIGGDRNVSVNVNAPAAGYVIVLEKRGARPIVAGYVADDSKVIEGEAHEVTPPEVTKLRG